MAPISPPSPHRSYTLGERTRASGAPTASSGAQWNASQAQRLTLEPITTLRTIVGNAFRAGKEKVLHPSRRRIGGILILALLATAYFYRDKLAEQKHFYDARSAIEDGDLALGERKLEELVETSPDFNEASELLVTVSTELVLPSLPKEFSAKHDHRLGSCTGRLTLHDRGVEYWSRKHGAWQWRFDNVRTMYNRGSWGISFETHEDDMLGLLSTKNYNFILLGDPLDEEFWKRFERLYEYRRAASETPAS